MGTEDTQNNHVTQNQGTTQPHLSTPPPRVKKGNETMMTIAGIAGNILEWYDFAIFGFFSEELSKVFFPPQEGNNALIETFTVFGAAFLMRPIGGVMMGYIGDVYGRKTALEISIFMMAFPTFTLGLLPTYDTVGPISYILLIIIRLMQGFSCGGQIMSSLVFTVERQPKEKWGLYGSYAMGASCMGTLMGSVVASISRAFLSPEQLIDWGWRIPFLFGILAGIPGVYLKYYCEEDGIPCDNVSDGVGSVNPIRAAFRRENLRALISATLVTMIWAGGFYLCFVWMAVFMGNLAENKIPGAFAINCSSLFICIAFFPVAGAMSDVLGRTKIMYTGSFGLVLLPPLVLHIISLGKPIPAFCAQLSLGVFLTLWSSPMCAWLVESFKPELRVTSVSISYNIAFGTIGGFSPSIATYLMSIEPLAPAYFLSGVAVLSIFGLCIAPKIEERDSYPSHPRSMDIDCDEEKLLRPPDETSSLFP